MSNNMTNYREKFNQLDKNIKEFKTKKFREKAKVEREEEVSELNDLLELVDKNLNQKSPQAVVDYFLWKVYDFGVLDQERIFDKIKSQTGFPKNKLKERCKEIVIETYNKNNDGKDIKFLDEKGNIKPQEIAQDILSDFKRIITTYDNEQLYYYKNGIYRNNSNTMIKEAAQKRLGDIKKHEKEEVIESLKGMTYIKRENINKEKHLIHLKNGIYNIDKEELIDFTPDIISTTQINAEYDPEADCPNIKEFIKEVVGEDQLPKIQEMVGYTLIKEYPYNKSFMLIGSGANGKSTLLNLLEKFLGPKNVSHASLQDLCYNRFAKIELYGKLANINNDLPSQGVRNSGTFKKLVGEDVVRGEKKHKDSFNFRNHAKLIFACNQLPETNDVTDGFFRRWELIEFPYKFTTKDDDHKDVEINILNRLTTEEELSGLFNWALEGLKRLLDNGFTETEMTKHVKDEWILRTNTLQAFVNRYVEYKQGKVVTKDDFYKAYTTFCDEHDIEAKKKNVVGRNLPTLVPKIDKSRPKVNGERRTCWVGLKVKDKYGQLVDDIEQDENEETENTRNSLSEFSGKVRKEDVIDIYDRKEAQSYVEIESEAQQKGIDPEDFNEWHEKLLKDGEIHETEPGKYKRL